MNGPTIVERSAFGVHPTSMKNAVKMPHAMSAGMFGMIMPDRYVPKRWTPTRALLVPVAGTDAVVMAVSPSSFGLRGRACGRSGFCGRAGRISGRGRAIRGQGCLGDRSGIVEGVFEE